MQLDVSRAPVNSKAKKLTSIIAGAAGGAAGNGTMIAIVIFRKSGGIYLLA